MMGKKKKKLQVLTIVLLLKVFEAPAAHKNKHQADQQGRLRVRRHAMAQVIKEIVDHSVGLCVQPMPTGNPLQFHPLAFPRGHACRRESQKMPATETVSAIPLLCFRIQNGSGTRGTASSGVLPSVVLKGPREQSASRFFQRCPDSFEREN